MSTCESSVAKPRGHAEAAPVPASQALPRRAPGHRSLTSPFCATSKLVTCPPANAPPRDAAWCRGHHQLGLAFGKTHKFSPLRRQPVRVQVPPGTGVLPATRGLTTAGRGRADPGEGHGGGACVCPGRPDRSHGDEHRPPRQPPAALPAGMGSRVQRRGEDACGGGDHVPGLAGSRRGAWGAPPRPDGSGQPRAAAEVTAPGGDTRGHGAGARSHHGVSHGAAHPVGGPTRHPLSWERGRGGRSVPRRA